MTTKKEIVLESCYLDNLVQVIASVYINVRMIVLYFPALHQPYVKVEYIEKNSCKFPVKFSSVILMNGDCFELSG